MVEQPGLNFCETLYDRPALKTEEDLLRQSRGFLRVRRVIVVDKSGSHTVLHTHRGTVHQFPRKLGRVSAPVCTRSIKVGIWSPVADITTRLATPQKNPTRFVAHQFSIWKSVGLAHESE